MSLYYAGMDIDIDIDIEEIIGAVSREVGATERNGSPARILTASRTYDKLRSRGDRHRMGSRADGTRPVPATRRPS